MECRCASFRDSLDRQSQKQGPNIGIELSHRRMPCGSRPQCALHLAQQAWRARRPSTPSANDPRCIVTESSRRSAQQGAL
jgi:hypothetical protein